LLSNDLDQFAYMRRFATVFSGWVVGRMGVERLAWLL
jgi:hypothetical protein